MKKIKRSISLKKSLKTKAEFNLTKFRGKILNFFYKQNILLIFCLLKKKELLKQRLQ